MNFKLIVTVPSAGVRVGAHSPLDVYGIVTDLLGTGYTADLIEWED